MKTTSNQVTKKRVLTAIQVIVTAGILFWIFHTHGADMWMVLTQKHPKPAWLLAGFAFYGFMELLGTVRWYILLRVQGIKLAEWRVCALLMLGIFFNMFMPGGTGGDVMKIVYLIKEVPEQKAKGLLAVLMDRLIGLMALIIISSVIIGLQYHWLRTSQTAEHLTWVLLGLLVSSLGAIVFSFAISGFGLAHKLPKRMPMRDKLIDMSVAYNAYARAWPASLVALIAAFGVHLSTFMMFVCAARALGVTLPSGAPISIGAVLTVMPIILTISALPISVGGTGVREALFAALLVPLCGIATPVAFTLSLTGFMLSAAWGVIGGIVYLLYRPSQHPKIMEAQLQVHELEHEIAEAE